MTSSRSAIMFLVACVVCLSYSMKAQDVLREQLFGETNQVIAQAKEKKADLYAPISFEKGMGYYNEASDELGRGGKLEDIREKLKNASAYFAKAMDACKVADVSFSATMGARTDAFSAGAPNYSPELWNKAETQFKRAARSLEGGYANSAKDDAAEAEKIYRTAELEAVKANYLNPARELLKQADGMDVKDNAPKTLEKARRLAKQVENLLAQKGYDPDEARQLAQEAKYEAAHALYLHQAIRKMKGEDKTFEDALLMPEPHFQRVAGTLGVQARFDKGYESPVNDVLAALKERDAKTEQDQNKLVEAAEAIKGKEREAENLRQQIAAMEGRLGSLTEAEKQLQQAGKDLELKLAVQNQQEATMRQVATMFSSDEGNVLRDRDNIVIRLYGLSFPVGERTIEAQYYPLLTKVQDVIKKFPKCKVTIEGHTDSQGSDETNQSLSELRAKTVAEYLMANMGAEMAIDYHGYGESRPVASNDTPEGRAKNRRIDVVIAPEWAGK